MKYPLQTLFEIRERAKKDAEDNYAREKKILDQEEAKLKEMQEKLEQMRQARLSKRDAYFQEMQEGKLSIKEIQMGRRHLEMLFQMELDYKEKINTQKEVVEEAKQKTSKALEVLTHATQEFKVLEKHKEKWTKKKKKEREKREEEAADDLSQSRYFIHLKELEDEQSH